jgi:hypothetical protein
MDMLLAAASSNARRFVRVVLVVTVVERSLSTG